MPFALLHGESLVAVASWALGEAGVLLLDFDLTWHDVQVLDRALVVHDPLCPMTPVEFLREAVAEAVEHDTVVVGVHPVTDPLRAVHDGPVAGARGREGLWAVASPVVLPASLVAALDSWPDTDDLAGLVARLREALPVRFLEAPALARRVEDVASVALLEAATDEAR